ncbi:unnamed protein product [Durusdinium trenchii]|uniref:Solute carrier family 40 protein n=1 Tax=Durusdinium trenchii TaxID=1381693 RepID=A0ABP0JV34_9DINO
MVLTNLAAPFWGVLADRGCLKRKHILMLGSLGEATAALRQHHFGKTERPGAALRTVRPIVNGIVADSTSDDRRGKMFSYVQSALLVGMCLTTLVAGNLANITIGTLAELILLRRATVYSYSNLEQGFLSRLKVGTSS